MEVFNSSGESGIVVLTFDNNKTLNVKFEYKMTISVDYSNELCFDASQYDLTDQLSRSDEKKFTSFSVSKSAGSLGNSDTAEERPEVFNSQGDRESQFSSSGDNVLGVDTGKQGISGRGIDVGDDDSCDFIEPNPNELDGIAVDQIEGSPVFSSQKRASKKKKAAFRKIAESGDNEDVLIKSLKLEPTADVGTIQKGIHIDLCEQESCLEDVKELDILSCQVCEKIFQSNEELINHGSIFISKEKCLVCQKEFESNANLLLHNYLSHRDSRKTSPVCPVCFAPFFDNLEVLNHLKSSHTSEEMYICCVCHNIFKDHCLFKKHLGNFKFKKVCTQPNISSGPRKPRGYTQSAKQKIKSCSVIIEKLSNAKSKKQTLRKTSSKSLKLNQQKDDKGSDADSTKATVRKSSREESGHMWYKCDTCQRLFKENWALRNHTKPYTLVDVCKKCGCKAYSKAEYLLHEYTRHSEEYKSDTAHGCKDLKCPSCKAICSSQDILYHIMTEHTKECPYICCICDKPFENTELYTLHVTSHQTSSTISITDSQISKLFSNISFKYAGNDDNDKTVCRLCKVEFVSRTEFLYHCQMEKEKKACNICDTPTFTEAGFIVHRYLSHGLSPDEQESQFAPTCYVNFNKNQWEEGTSDECNELSSKTLKCPCCSENVSTQDLVFHVMEMHTRESLLKCCACNNESSTFNEYIEHCNFHLGKKIYDAESAQCTRCNLRFDSRLSVTRHQGIWHKKFTCSLCQISFANTILLEEHLHSLHQDEAKRCSFCGKLFCDAATLAWHERHHYYQKKIPCTICGEVLSSKRTLSFHMQVKHSDSGDLSHLRVLCTTCGKMVAKSSIATHRASHTNDRTHDCSICHKSFKHRSKVLQHVTRVHMKHIKSFICDVCGKNCTTRYNLKIHMRIHSSVKAFSCSLCGQGFNYNQSLQAHIAKKHSSISQSYS